MQLPHKSHSQTGSVPSIGIDRTLLCIPYLVEATSTMRTIPIIFICIYVCVMLKRTNGTHIILDWTWQHDDDSTQQRTSRKNTSNDAHKIMLNVYISIFRILLHSVLDRNIPPLHSHIIVLNNSYRMLNVETIFSVSYFLFLYVCNYYHKSNSTHKHTHRTITRMPTFYYYIIHMNYVIFLYAMNNIIRILTHNDIINNTTDEKIP